MTQQRLRDRLAELCRICDVSQGQLDTVYDLIPMIGGMDDVRLFVNEEGGLEIQRRIGKTYRILEIPVDGDCEFHSLDVEKCVEETRWIYTYHGAVAALRGAPVRAPEGK